MYYGLLTFAHSTATMCNTPYANANLAHTSQVRHGDYLDQACWV